MSLRGFVFMFDVLLALLSLPYLLSFVFAVPGPAEGLLLDFSAFSRVSDFLIIADSAQDYSPMNHTSLFGRETCFPLNGGCEEGKEWVCGGWNRSSYQGGKVVFEPLIVCVEGFA
jgi:hypothetical protein